MFPKVKIVINAVELEGKARTGALRQRIVKEEILRAVTLMTFAMRNILVKNSPSVSGLMRNSWQVQVIPYAKQTTGVVSSTQVSAKVFEDGAKNHFPPVTKGRFRSGRRGRRKLLPLSIPYANAGPALGGWIMKKLGVTDPRKILRLAFVIGRKFKRQGRPQTDRWSKLLMQARPGFRTVLRQMLVRIIMRFRSRG